MTTKQVLSNNALLKWKIKIIGFIRASVKTFLFQNKIHLINYFENIIYIFCNLAVIKCVNQPNKSK